MFGLGMPEILLILAIALIVIGPKKLPELAKTLGRAMGEFKRSAQDFKRSIDIETTVGDIDPPRQTDLKKVVKEANAAPAAQSPEAETKDPEEAAGDPQATHGEAPAPPKEAPKPSSSD